MREICTSGSEGGGAVIPFSLPLSNELEHNLLRFFLNRVAFPRRADFGMVLLLWLDCNWDFYSLHVCEREIKRPSDSCLHLLDPPRHEGRPRRDDARRNLQRHGVRGQSPSAGRYSSCNRPTVPPCSVQRNESLLTSRRSGLFSRAIRLAI